MRSIARRSLYRWMDLWIKKSCAFLATKKSLLRALRECVCFNNEKCFFSDGIHINLKLAYAVAYADDANQYKIIIFKLSIDYGSRNCQRWMLVVVYLLARSFAVRSCNRKKEATRNSFIVQNELIGFLNL